MIYDEKNFDQLSPELQERFNYLKKSMPKNPSKTAYASDLNTPMDFQTPVQQDVPRETFNNTKEIPENNNLGKFPIGPLEVKQEQPAEPEQQQPPKFNTTGKVHPVLQKMRSVFGVQDTKYEIVLGGIAYELAALNRAMFQQATFLAVLMSSNDDYMYRSNLELAIIAFSIQKLDRIPLADIFQIPHQEENGEQLTDQQRHAKAAFSMFDELKSGPNELVDALTVSYQQQFPPLEILGKDKTIYYCPVANCTESKIYERGATLYCSQHGQVLYEEGMLPQNPF